LLGKSVEIKVVWFPEQKSGARSNYIQKMWSVAAYSKTHGFLSRSIWILTLTLPIICCVTLSKSPKTYLYAFLSIKPRETISFSLTILKRNNLGSSWKYSEHLHNFMIFIFTGELLKANGNFNEIYLILVLWLIWKSISYNSSIFVENFH
jgi:hypothetical protein